MGWFNKKEKKSKKGTPSLPELPKLPELPDLNKLEKTKAPKQNLQQLPSYPTNSIGNKFSQSNIKETVTGKKEHEDIFDIDNFAVEESPTPINVDDKPLRKPRTVEVSPEPERKKEVPREFKEAAKKVKSMEPVFIRIDKFEESMKTFTETKERISEIEKMLRDIKKIKEEEEKELETWENEMKNMKNQIERVDRDIFSKIE